ncbi:unnamed protein product [Effrenium voratum]|nr:unnamed protein product [Effrenium voratum]
MCLWQELTIRTNITHVLNLAQEVNLKEDIRTLLTEYNAERGLEFVYKKEGLGDTPDQSLTDIDGLLDFIHGAHQANERHHVLVNCVQGISRSAAVVLAYLMKYERMSLRDAYHFLRHRRSIADPRKEFLQQLGVLERRLFGLEAPTLSGEVAFAGRHMLNLDDAPMPVPQKDVEDPEMRHELQALQKVLQHLNSHLQSIGAEAEAAAQAVRTLGQEAGVAACDVHMTSVTEQYVMQKQHNCAEPEMESELHACKALLDYMSHAAAAMLEERDNWRRQAEEEDTRGGAVRPIV